MQTDTLSLRAWIGRGSWSVFRKMIILARGFHPWQIWRKEKLSAAVAASKAIVGILRDRVEIALSAWDVRFIFVRNAAKTSSSGLSRKKRRPDAEGGRIHRETFLNTFYFFPIFFLSISIPGFPAYPGRIYAHSFYDRAVYR